MAEYIEREEARPDAFCIGVSCQDCPFLKSPLYGGCRIDDFIASIPAADVRPVVRGKWLNDFCGKGRFSKRIVQCSLCGNFLDLDGVNAGRGDANYCPNCGADMREDSDV